MAKDKLEFMVNPIRVGLVFTMSCGKDKLEFMVNPIRVGLVFTISYGKR